MLLNDRHFLRRHLHTEVAAGHHHAIGHVEYFFQMLNGLWLL